jgi:hypothetical protein
MKISSHQICTIKTTYQWVSAVPLETIQLFKKIFFTNGSPKVEDKEPKFVKNCGCYKTSHLNNGNNVTDAMHA